MCLNQFVCGLPNVPAFNSLRSDLPTRVASAGDQDSGAFIALTEKALELDTIFRSILPPSRVHSQLPSSTSTLPSVPTLPPSVPPVMSSSTAIAPATPYSSKICSNCGRKGHVAATCFASGGGMEGQRAEYKRDRGKVIAMLLASLDESVKLDDPGPEPMPVDLSESSFTPPLSPDTLDDHIIVPTMASLSVSTSSAAQNDIIRRDLYSQCESPKLLPLALVAPTELEHTAYLSLGGYFNSCLDSGCTDHIITDRCLFQTYDTSGSIEIGTANCGSLSAKASGNVSFRVPFQDRFVIFTLRGCLHAPDAPLHLLSVGALNERGMTVTFNTFGHSTILSFPSSDPELPGFYMSAEVIRRLS